jgi:hypothetical protein
MFSRFPILGCWLVSFLGLVAGTLKAEEEKQPLGKFSGLLPDALCVVYVKDAKPRVLWKLPDDREPPSANPKAPDCLIIAESRRDKEHGDIYRQTTITERNGKFVLWALVGPKKHRFSIDAKELLRCAEKDEVVHGVPLGSVD